MAVESDGKVWNKVKSKKDKYCPMHRQRLTRYKSFELPKKELEHFLSLIAGISKTCEAIEKNGKVCDKKRKERHKYCSMHIWRYEKYEFLIYLKKKLKYANLQTVIINASEIMNTVNVAMISMY